MSMNMSLLRKTGFIPAKEAGHEKIPTFILQHSSWT